MSALVLGVDSGGSGLRVTLARRSPGAEGPRVLGGVRCAEPVRTGPAGIDADHMAEQLLPAVRELCATAGAGREPVAAACVGAAGMATLGASLRTRLPGLLREGCGVRALVLAADAVTAYAGALGQRPGAVVAAGTGMVATGTDLARWRRADGWGHLLGDCGGGAWIGRAGLDAALRAVDGRPGGSAVLRARAEERFGAPLSGLPAQLYPRADRAAVLASFVPDVADGCAEGDPVASRIVRAAAEEIADSAAAVCPAQDGGGGATDATGTAVVACTGGLFRLGEVLQGPVRAGLAARLPGVEVVEAAGDPLDGAVLLAHELAADRLALPRDPALLTVTGPGARQG